MRGYWRLVNLGMGSSWIDRSRRCTSTRSTAFLDESLVPRTSPRLSLLRARQTSNGLSISDPTMQAGSSNSATGTPGSKTQKQKQNQALFNAKHLLTEPCSSDYHPSSPLAHSSWRTAHTIAISTWDSPSRLPDSSRDSSTCPTSSASSPFPFNIQLLLSFTRSLPLAVLEINILRPSLPVLESIAIVRWAVSRWKFSVSAGLTILENPS